MKPSLGLRVFALMFTLLMVAAIIFPYTLNKIGYLKNPKIENPPPARGVFFVLDNLTRLV